MYFLPLPQGQGSLGPTLCSLRTGARLTWDLSGAEVPVSLAHRSGKGAKYTRGRSPLELKYREGCGTHSDALKRELEIKHLSREEKLALIGETE